MGGERQGGGGRELAWGRGPHLRNSAKGGRGLLCVAGQEEKGADLATFAKACRLRVCDLRR
jgi:hypothetical protein